MAALLAQQQSMIMAAAAAQNIQAAVFMQGQNQASSNEKSGAGSSQGNAFGQQWSAADLQALGGLVSKPGVQNGGLPFSQVENHGLDLYGIEENSVALVTATHPDALVVILSDFNSYI